MNTVDTQRSDAHSLRLDLHDVIVGLMFCLVSAFLILSGDGIPYVFDANETFSSILHARNFLNFDLSTSFGLADESTAPFAAGHAVVHTHQGNFPRIFATLLYALGVQSAAGQIIVTTFTVGLGAVLLLNRVLRRHYGDGLAMVAMLLMLTDYILFAQWQVVTYRVWHVVFLSLTLFTVSRYHFTRERKYLLIAMLVWWGLYYSELVYAVFLSVSVGMWALWIMRRSIFGAVKCISTALLGAMLGVATVILQLIGYLGWEGFKKDLSLTYFARNNAAESGDLIEMLRTYYDDKNVAFFYNLMDGGLYRNVQSFVDGIFKWGLQAYTPALTFTILIILLGAVLRGSVGGYGRVRAPSLTIVLITVLFVVQWAIPGSVYVLGATVAFAVGHFLFGRARAPGTQMMDRVHAVVILWGQATVLLSAMALDGRVLGLRPHMVELSATTLILAVVAMLLAGWGWSHFVLRHVDRHGGRVAFADVVRVSLFWLLVLALMGYQHRLYDQSQSVVWFGALSGGTGWQWILKGGIALSILTVTGWLLPSTHQARFYQLPQGVRDMSILFGCTMIGFATALILFPGYIFSGYLFRFAPFLYFPLILIIAMGVYILGHDVMLRFREAAVSDKAIPALSFAFVVIFWGSVQMGNAALFPADDFSVIKSVEALNPENPTIATNSYAAPFSVVTGNWGYLDHTLGEGKAVLTKDGYDMERDDRYWWFADRKNNPDYNRPSHFVCYIPQNYWTATINLTTTAPWCSNLGLMRLAQQPPDQVWPDHKIIAQDQSGTDRWAVIALDWDFSPYITSPPEVSIVEGRGQRDLMVYYAYRHQEQKAEARSMVNLYSVRQDGRYCEIVQHHGQAETGQGGQAKLSVAGGGNDMRIVGVRPMTATRSGTEFFSQPFILDAAGIHSAQRCMYIKLRDGNLVDQTWLSGADK